MQTIQLQLNPASVTQSDKEYCYFHWTEINSIAGETHSPPPLLLPELWHQMEAVVYISFEDQWNKFR